MSDFASMAEKKEDEIKAMLTELKEGIQDTFSGGEQLDLTFEKGAFTTGDQNPIRDQYNLTWKAGPLQRYQSAYTTFARIAINPVKGERANDTLVEALKKGKDIDSDQVENFIKNAKTNARKKLEEFYKDKYQKVYDGARHAKDMSQLLKDKTKAEDHLAHSTQRLQELPAEINKADAAVKNMEAQIKAYTKDQRDLQQALTDIGALKQDHQKRVDQRAKIKANEKELKKAERTATNLRKALAEFERKFKYHTKQTEKLPERIKEFTDWIEEGITGKDLKWDSVIVRINAKYKLRLPPTSDGDAVGQAIATYMINHKGASERLSELINEQLFQDIEAKLRETRLPGTKGSIAADKLAGKVARSNMLVSVIAYELQYRIYKFDADEAQKRYEKVLASIEKEKRAALAQSNKGLTTLYQSIQSMKSNVSGTPPTGQALTIQQQMEQALEEQAQELLSDIKEIDKEYKKAIADAQEDWAEVRKYLNPNDSSNWAIGNFTIRPIGGRGKLRTGIGYHNTNADMTAEVSAASDEITVRLTYGETTKGLFALGHERHNEGNIAIRATGKPVGDGSIGMQFNKFLQSYS